MKTEGIEENTANWLTEIPIFINISLSGSLFSHGLITSYNSSIKALLQTLAKLFKVSCVLKYEK